MKPEDKSVLFGLGWGIGGTTFVFVIGLCIYGSSLPKTEYTAKVEIQEAPVSFYDTKYINSLPESISTKGQLFKYHTIDGYYYCLRIVNYPDTIIECKDANIKVASDVADISKLLEETDIKAFFACAAWPVVAVRVSKDKVVYKWELWDYDLFEAYHRHKDKKKDIEIVVSAKYELKD